METSAIDLVTHDPASDEFALIIVLPEQWVGSEEELTRLQEKLNNYLTFALAGQMESLYPASKGKQLRIQIDCKTHPTGPSAIFLDETKKLLEAKGIRFIIYADT